MAATGSHPAMKLKKHIHLAVDSNRRPSQSNPPSQPDSTNTLTTEGAPSSGFNAGRRKSTYKPNTTGLVAAAMNMRRMTRASIPQVNTQEIVPKINVRYENTYKMEPEEGAKFSYGHLEMKIYAMLEEHAKDMTYDPAEASNLSQMVADMVKNTAKGMCSPRYKLVTSVVVGQNQQQGIEMASRCLWDEGKDNFASVCYKNKSLVITVLIFGCYFE